MRVQNSSVPFVLYFYQLLRVTVDTVVYLFYFTFLTYLLTISANNDDLYEEQLREYFAT